jgi:hypothetical protein
VFGERGSTLRRKCYNRMRFLRAMKDDYSNVREYHQMLLRSLLATKAPNRNGGPATSPAAPAAPPRLLLSVLLLLLLHLLLFDLIFKHYLILFLPLLLLVLLLPPIHKLLLLKVEWLTSTDLNLNVANLL